MALATAHVCYSQPEAEVLKSRLNASGIEAFVFDGGINSTAPHMAVAVGGIRVMVLQENFKDATAIIDARDDTQLESESAAFRRNTSKGFIGLIASFLVAWFPWWNTKRKFKDD